MKKKKPRNLKQTTTQMEKQTQVREIVTNTNWSVNYMPQPSDGALRVVMLIPSDGIGPLVIGAVERRRMLRESWRNRFGTMRLRLSWRSSTFGKQLTRSLIYKPISSPSPPSDPPTDLTAIRPTRRFRRCQSNFWENGKERRLFSIWFWGWIWFWYCCVCWRRWWCICH